MKNDEEKEVTKRIYDKFNGYNYLCIYYTGIIEKGIIFSLYPSMDYEL